MSSEQFPLLRYDFHLIRRPDAGSGSVWLCSLGLGRGHNDGGLRHGRSCRDKFGVKEQVDRHAKLAIQIMKHPPTYKRPKRLLFDVIAFLENIRRSFPSFVRQFRGYCDTLTGKHSDDDLA